MHVLTSQFFVKIYYGAPVWLPSLAQVVHRVDRIHYRALRVGIHDYRNQVSKESLDTDFKRATPCEWSDYCCAQEMIRVFNSESLLSLFHRLEGQVYFMKRKQLVRFYDSS
jgi:hypothetical protein